MKLTIQFCLAVFYAFGASALDRPLESVAKEIKNVREQRTDFRQRRKAMTDPALTQETDEVIAVLAKKQRDLEAEFKELRSRLDIRQP